MVSHCMVEPNETILRALIEACDGDSPNLDAAPRRRVRPRLIARAVWPDDPTTQAAMRVGRHLRELERSGDVIQVGGYWGPTDAGRRGAGQPREEGA